MLIALSGVSHADVSLDFDKTFNAVGEPRQLHFQATYKLNAADHTTELWRDRDQRLKRRTDDVVETFVFEPAKETEWRMVVLDLKHKVRTDIDRTNLFRVGHFTDWFSLSHALTRPSGAYQLVATSAPKSAEKPVADCRWYALNRNGTDSKLCWSAKVRLPLMITAADGAVQWRVTQLDVKPVTVDTYKVMDSGFARNDANADINDD